MGRSFVGDPPASSAMRLGSLASRVRVAKITGLGLPPPLRSRER